MLVLSRKQGEKLVIGEGIEITVVKVAGNRVRLGVSAPQNVRVLRGELAQPKKHFQIEMDADSLTASPVAFA